MLFFAGGVCFVFYSYHYVILLLGLEFIVLSLFLGFCVSGGRMNSFFLMFFFLVLVVCLGGYGLSLLVALSRVYGREGVLY